MSSESINVGAGRRCINPTMPLGLAGYFNTRMWDCVRDNIEVRALVFKSGENFSAVVQYDLVAVSSDLQKKMLDGLAKAGFKQLRGDNIVTNATHTHTAPELRIGRGGYNADYIEFAAAQAAAALCDAMADLESCSVEHGVVADPRFLFNRRYWMKNGTVVTNPGKLNPEIVRPEGEIDPEIPLLAFKRDGKIKALIANIVNHSDTIGGCGVSGDWPGFTVRALEKRIGSGSMVIPLLGCAGNINHFDVSSDADQTCYSEAERIGAGYAETIGESLDSLRPMANVEMKTYFSRIKVPSRELSPEEIADAQAVMAKYPEVDVDQVGGPDLTSEDLAKQTPFALKYFAKKTLEIATNSEVKSFNLVRLDIGSAVIATLPGEPFVEIGLRIRKGFFHGRTAMVASLANGSATGYIPNCWNYGRGGYETTPRSNPFAIDAAEILLNAWRELSQK